MRHLFGKVLIMLAATILCAATSGIGSARAEPRVALVIGNSNYGGDLGVLPNPANDAKLMAKTLRQVGFEVIEVEDADQQAMKQAISDFGEKLANAGEGSTGLFFYAGHGLQVDGINYLIPVHVTIKRERDVDIQAVPGDLVLKQMQFAGSAVNIIILDACRNNPLHDSRGMSRGLAEITSKPRGSFISYSTAPGDVAEDGNGADSPYTMALAAAIQKPGLGLEDVFRDVRGKVLAATDQKQTPWDSSSLTNEFYFLPPTGNQVAAAPAAAQSSGPASGDSKALELSFWESIKTSSDPEVFRAYLEQFPTGTFAKLAEIRVKALTAQAGTAVAQNNRGVPDATAPVTAFSDTDTTVYSNNAAPLRLQPDPNGEILTHTGADIPIQATGRSSDGKWWRLALPNGKTAYIASDDAHQDTAAGGSTATTQTAAATPPASDFEVCRGDDVGNQERLQACHRAIDGGDLAANDRAQALDRLGQAYLGSGMAGEAVASFRVAAEADPAPALYRSDLGQALLQSGDLRSARQAFDDALKIEPENALALERRGEVSLGLGDVKAAHADFDHAVAANPQLLEAYDMRILAHLSLADTAGAAADADAAAAVEPTYWSVKAIAAYLMAKRVNQAGEMAERVMADDPDSPYSWIWNALVLKAQNRTGEAVEQLRSNLQQAENRDWPMPIVEWLAGERSDQDLNRAASDSDSIVAARQRDEAAFYLGLAALNSGDTAAAKKLLTEAAGGNSRDRLEYAAAPALLATIDQTAPN